MVKESLKDSEPSAAGAIDSLSLQIQPKASHGTISKVCTTQSIPEVCTTQSLRQVCTTPGPFQIVSSNQPVVDDAPLEPPRRRYSCPNYDTCLDLAAALNWDSFTCRGCNGCIDGRLYWRAKQALRRDGVARKICELPAISVLVNGTRESGTRESGAGASALGNSSETEDHPIEEQILSSNFSGNAAPLILKGNPESQEP